MPFSDPNTDYNDYTDVDLEVDCTCIDCALLLAYLKFDDALTELPF